MRENVKIIIDSVKTRGYYEKREITRKGGKMARNKLKGRIVEKYKAKELEVSISSTGCLKDGYSHSLMISTMWLAKNHKEKTE